MEFVLLLIGLTLIIKSADILIDSTSKIARKYGVSTFIIGITVIAFGTSAPEFVVGLMSAISKTNQLSLGNIIGSSFANTALIIGMSATIFPLVVKDTVVKREIPMLILVQVVLAIMILADGKLTRLEGFILLLGFVGFIAYIIINSKKSMHITIDCEGDLDTDGDGNMVKENPEFSNKSNLVKLWIFSILSLVGLFIGGKLAVDSSTQIAINFGLSETIIGLTVVAIATTLPELITSLMAVKKKEPEIVLGNCIGSNLFNILLVLGLSSTINPITIQGDMTLDVLFMILLTVLVFITSLVVKRVPRLFGIVLMTSYVAYITFKVIIALTINTAT